MTHIGWCPFARLPHAVTALVIALSWSAVSANAEDVRVMSSGATAPAWRTLAVEFERATQHKTVTLATQTGVGAESIPNRVRSGESVDIVMLPAAMIDALEKDGYVQRGSRVDLARSNIGIAVRQGTPKPTIRSVEDLKRALLQAQSIGVSLQVSGQYVVTELIPQLGIADQVLAKVRRAAGEMVGELLLRGDAEMGLQQISELLAIPGIIYVGPLPVEVQRTTLMSAAIASSARSSDAARALLRFLATPQAGAVMKATGLEPLIDPR